MSPWLLFGFLVAGVLSVIIPTQLVQKHLSGKGFGAVIKASLFGIPLPLCSCGVIPVGVSLRKNGASRGAALSFLISTPQTGVDSIAVTYSLLGPLLAIYRPIVAFITGVLGGLIGNLLKYDDDVQMPLNDGQAGSSCCSGEEQDSSCCTPEVAANISSDAKPGALSSILNIFSYGFIVLPRDIAKSLLIGLIIAGLITALIPAAALSSFLGGGLLAMLIMVLISVPMYVCATASVPIAAAMVLAGVSYGAAFVFLVAGPATNAATITTIGRALGKRTAALYVAIVMIGAVLAGLLLDSFYQPSIVLDFAHQHSFFPHWFTTGCAFAMLAMLGYALLPTRRHQSPKSSQISEVAIEQVVLNVTGMNCEHCRNSVSQELMKQAGVSSVIVDLAAASAQVMGQGYDTDALLSAVRNVGYQAELMVDKPNR